MTWLGPWVKGRGRQARWIAPGHAATGPGGNANQRGCCLLEELSSWRRRSLSVVCEYARPCCSAARTLSHNTAALPIPSCESLIFLLSVAVFCAIEASWTGSSIRITDVSCSRGDTNHQSLTIYLCLKAPTRLSTPQLHIFPAAWASISKTNHSPAARLCLSEVCFSIRPTIPVRPFLKVHLQHAPPSCIVPSLASWCRRMSVPDPSVAVDLKTGRFPPESASPDLSLLLR